MWTQAKRDTVFVHEVYLFAFSPLFDWILGQTISFDRYFRSMRFFWSIRVYVLLIKCLQTNQMILSMAPRERFIG